MNNFYIQTNIWLLPKDEVDKDKRKDSHMQADCQAGKAGKAGRMAKYTHLLCLLTRFFFAQFLSFLFLLSFSHTQSHFDECVNVCLLLLLLLAYLYFLFCFFVFVFVFQHIHLSYSHSDHVCFLQGNHKQQARLYLTRLQFKYKFFAFL